MPIPKEGDQEIDAFDNEVSEEPTPFPSEHSIDPTELDMESICKSIRLNIDLSIATGSPRFSYY